MATKLGDVSLTLKLDASEVERELVQLEARTREVSRETGTAGETPAQAARLRSGPAASWTKAPSPRQMTKRQIEGFFTKMEEHRVQKRKADLARATAAATRHPMTGSTLAQRPAISDIPGADAAMRRLGLAGMESVNVTSTLGLAGAIYAGISETAKATPILISAIRGALDIKPGTNPAFDMAEKTAEKLRDVVVDFEAKAKGYFKGYSDSLQMAGAVARVTGQVPTIGVPGLTATSSYYAIFAEKARQESELDSKFEEFKMKDIGEAVGDYFATAFKSSMRQ